MKDSSEKSSSTTSATTHQSTSQPFFVKAGGGGFFAPDATAAPAVQMKMAVSKPGEKLEQGADKVMRMSAPIAGKEEKLQRQPEEKLQKKGGDTIQKAAMSEEKLQKKEEDKLHKAPATEEKLQRKGDGVVPAVGARPATEATDTAPASVARVLVDSGRPLAPAFQQDMEQRFGHDFSRVRVHSGGAAEQSTQEVNAHAYTVGHDIVFGAGQFAPETSGGQRLIAHELTHVVQQKNLSNRVQRYEAGEHAQLGETQAELQAAFAPTSYIVQKGEKLRTIAEKFEITVAELKEANKDKLKKWPASDGSGRMIEGFNVGEKISIPQRLNDFAKAATKDKSATFTVNGVVLDYGVGIAMGDLFESPEQMVKASPTELQGLAALIKREQISGKAVTTEEWQKATGGRFLNMAKKNISHFAPPSAGLVSPSAAGAASSDHKSEWEKHHGAALDMSRAGNKDNALMTNAFGDHFLTDAFSATSLKASARVVPFPVPIT